jgi:hypothetical protein
LEKYSVAARHHSNEAEILKISRRHSPRVVAARSAAQSSSFRPRITHEGNNNGNRQLRGENGVLREENDSLRLQIACLAQENEELHNQHRLISASRTKDQRKLSNFSSKLSEVSSMLSECRRQMRALDKERAELQFQNQQLRQFQCTQEEILCAVQAQAIGMLEKAEWAPAEDSVIRREISILQKNIKDWCKASSKTSIRESSFSQMTVGDKEHLKGNWVYFAKVNQQTDLPCGFEKRESERKCWLLLSAWLGNFICHFVFGNPFFAVESGQEMAAHDVFSGPPLALLEEGKISVP